MRSARAVMSRYLKVRTEKTPSVQSFNVQSYSNFPLPGENYTRLLKLYPTHTYFCFTGFSTDLECEIIEVSLDSSPNYEALSYPWGSSERNVPILIRPPHSVLGRRKDMRWTLCGTVMVSAASAPIMKTFQEGTDRESSYA